MNRVQLIGNLTKDIEFKQTPTGKAVGNGSIATNRTYTDQAGQKQTVTQFHNFVVWGKQAETLAKWTKKGDKIYLEGELTHREYTTQDGIKKYFTEININSFEFLPNGKREDQARGNQQPANEPEEEEEIKVENIPF